MTNPKDPSWYSGGLTGPQFDQPGMGATFYVDGSNGLDTNPGTNDLPFLTITAAIAACTAGANDYIIVKAYPNPAPGTETFPIAMTKSKVHLIGTMSQASPSPYINPPADTHCIAVTASNCEIAGFELGAGATKACIDISGVTWKTNVHHCWMGWQDTCLNGVILSAGTDDAPQSWIHDNFFGINITGTNLYVTFNSTRSLIERNTFIGVATLGIHVDNTIANAVIRDNFFRVPDSATGEAITLDATAADGAMLYGNQAMQGAVAMGNVAFRDLGTNHWGLNYVDITATMPVTA
jgi:hypothetical protein